jgi:hypothetical protein
MSVGGVTAAATDHTPAAEITDSGATLLRKSHTNISLSGAADGDYTSTFNDFATKYHVSAAGTITPVGSVGIRGSFHSGRKSGQNSGSLTIVGVQGTLRLELKAESPPIASVSNRAHDTINPGGPIQGLCTVNPGGPSAGGSSMTSTVGEPIILVNDFTYTITGGTGKYANDRGSGTVEITTTPGLMTPQGPGIYSSTAATDTGVGQTTITFGTGLLAI